jgi:hypothetical protein
MNEVTQFLIEQGYVVLFLWVLFEQLGFPVGSFFISYEKIEITEIDDASEG